MDAAIQKAFPFRSSLCVPANRVDRFSRDGWGSGGHCDKNRPAIRLSAVLLTSRVRKRRSEQR
jgi:hypothetical protein